MNDLLKAALQAKYGLNRKEANDRIKSAKENGKLLELYQIALMKFELEMSHNV